MSYYFKTLYQFSYHGIARMKERLKIKDLTDIEMQAYCLKLINESHYIEETRSYKYVRVKNSNLFFIIKKDISLILTISPISPVKLLAIIEEDL